ncbi:MAG: hypothetical protein ACXWNK_11825 [Vulcanimicrobiaceae bacterium]
MRDLGEPARDATERAVTEVPEQDQPLPNTLRFVLVMGAAFFVGWFALFALLKERW